MARDIFLRHKLFVSFEVCIALYSVSLGLHQGGFGGLVDMFSRLQRCFRINHGSFGRIEIAADSDGGYRHVPMRTGGARFRIIQRCLGLIHCHARLLPIPEASIQPGETLYVPLLIGNATTEPVQVTLRLQLPAGWKEKAGTARYTVSPGGVYPVQAALIVPATKAPEWQEVTFRAEAGGKTIGSVTLRVNVASGGLPQ